MAIVARRLMAAEAGKQIPTISDLAAESGTGTGTVQAALKSLTDGGAVTLTRHGHRGTTLVERDLARLWAAASRGPVTGILPLPGSIEFSGLATAVVDAFDQAEVPLTLAFRLGSTKRVDFLAGDGADFMACSVGYARTLDPELFEFLDLGPSTYYTPDSVAVITRSGERPGPNSRVAIDHQSHDHALRTEAEFPDAELVECAYPQIPDLIVRGVVDAAVWHRTSSSPLLTATGLSIHPLTRPAPAKSDELARAALVTQIRTRSPAWALLSSVIDPISVQKIQNEVINSERVPSF